MNSVEGTKHQRTAAGIWEWDLNWVREADGIIAEVTQPSLGVGYELGKAHEWGKPVLALYRPTAKRKLSPMVAGSPNVIVFEYDNITETESAIREFLHKL